MAQNKLDSIVQIIIPPLLVVLLTLTIFEIFTDMSKYYLLIDIFDLFVVTIFAIDLYFRKKETKSWALFFRKYWIDILATIPFNLIFLTIDYLAFTRGLKFARVAARFLKFTKNLRLLRLLRLGLRLPRFLRIRHHVKETKIRKVQPHEEQMEGTLSFRVILLITINSIMGTGIFFLAAAGAEHAGPASLISWVILSLISIYIAMSFSELTSMFPKAGGVYEFAKQTYGRFWSFVIGWSTAIAGSVTISMLLLGALQYLIPIEYQHFYIPVAIVLIIIFHSIAYKGMQTSTVMLVSFALITLGTVASLLIPGFFSVNIDNLTPFFVFPSINIALAIFFIAETFFGWESAIFLSAETKNPEKVMPKALIIGTSVIALLAITLAFVGMGIMPWQEFAESSAPLKDMGSTLFGGIGTVIFTLLVFTSIIGAVACWVVTAPRLLMSIAEDKLFFVQFAKIHPKNKSPYVSIIFQALVITTLVIIGSGSYETLLHLLVPLILFLYSAVLISVTLLRFKRPEQPRPFKVPFGKIGPIFTVLFMGFLLYMFVNETHHSLEILRISGLLICLGIPAYFFIEIFYDDKYTKLRKDALANILTLVDKLPLSKKEFNNIIKYTEPYTKNKTILDFNCSVGSFTRMLIKKGVPFKKIYAVDQSQEEISIFKKNIPKEYKDKIDILYRDSWQVPKAIKKVDIFISFNSLGYISKPKDFLKHVKERLKKGGKFCFHIKNSFINMTPNALMLDDRKKVLKLFESVGLKAEYYKKKKLGKELIYIHGKKP